MSKVYIIPAEDKETRNPNRPDVVVPAHGLLVAQTQVVYRAVSRGVVALVSFNPAQGIPVFDMKVASHIRAAEAYAVFNLEDALEQAKLTMTHKGNDLTNLAKELAGLRKRLVKSQLAYGLAMSEVIKLEGDEEAPSEEELKKMLAEDDFLNKLACVVDSFAELCPTDEDIAELEDDETKATDTETETQNSETTAPEGETNPEEGETVDPMIALITSAVAKLEDGNKDHWTNAGSPDVKVLNNLLNEGLAEDADEIKLSAAQRDEYWEIIKPAPQA